MIRSLLYPHQNQDDEVEVLRFNMDSQLTTGSEPSSVHNFCPTFLLTSAMSNRLNDRRGKVDLCSLFRNGSEIAEKSEPRLKSIAPLLLLVINCSEEILPRIQSRGADRRVGCSRSCRAPRPLAAHLRLPSVAQPRYPLRGACRSRRWA